jgi:hypothetical protein
MREIAMVFFIAAFVLFVATSFWYANSENSGAKRAFAKAEEAFAQAQALKEEVERGNLELRRLLDQVMAKEVETNKLKQKVEWLEIKANAQAQKLLEPQKPIRISLIYRDGDKPKATPKFKLDESIKRKIKEITQ